jgi:TolB protein
VPTSENSTTTLYLVDPEGGRYPITTFAPGDPTSPNLVDWSGDGSRALFSTIPAVNVTGAMVVDLNTGTKTTVPVDGDPQFTRPDGKALLVTHYQGGAVRYKLDRFGLDGTHQQSYPVDKLGSDFDGTHLSTPDGTQLVLGTSTDLILMGNDGTVGSNLPVPGQKYCGPLRWWDGETGTIVLATCSDGNSRGLWLVPIDGSTPTALTTPLVLGQQSGPDLGDSNAWQLPAGTFVQASGPSQHESDICNPNYLAKLNPDGTTSQVSVPETAGGIPFVIGVHDGGLDIQTTALCGGGQALLSYDPATNTSTVLLGPSVNGGGVRTVVVFPDAR